MSGCRMRKPESEHATLGQGEHSFHRVESRKSCLKFFRFDLDRTSFRHQANALRSNSRLFGTAVSAFSLPSISSET